MIIYYFVNAIFEKVIKTKFELGQKEENQNYVT